MEFEFTPDPEFVAHIEEIAEKHLKKVVSLDEKRRHKEAEGRSCEKCGEQLTDHEDDLPCGA